MEQLLHPGWWFSFFPQAAFWWFFCLLSSIAALPLCLRIFRGMADRGAGLSTGVGLILTTYIAWLLSLGWFTYRPESAVVRLFLLVVGCAFLIGAMLFRKRRRPQGLAGLAIFFPAALLLLLGLVALPHGFLSIWISLLLLATGSVAAWAAEPARLIKELRKSAVPFLLGQVLFLIALLFFVNVRSYIPYATFEISLYQAEKWGNMTHINSVMSSDFLPPKDIWFNEYPTNYYYGGHLLTATIAKATFTKAEVAFNLGLATIFALTFTMGFFFVLSLVQLTSRKYRLGPIVWHTGLSYAFLGAFAIAMFGNLDAYRQLFTRGADGGVNFRWERARLSEQQDWKLATGILASVGVRAYAAAAKETPYQGMESLKAELQKVLDEKNDAAAQAEQLAVSIESRVKQLESAPRVSSRRQEDALSQVLFTPQSQATFENLTSVNSVKFTEHLFQLMVQGDFEEIPEELREAAKEHEDYLPRVSVVLERVNATINDALNSTAVKDFAAELSSRAAADPNAQLYGMPATQASTQLRDAIAAKSYQNTGEVIKKFYDVYRKQIRPPAAEKELEQKLRAARDELMMDPVALLDSAWGSQPPARVSNPNIDDIRFSWENATYINFWDPSRAIKSSPPGEKNSGTITEFPYFSAILGDHHPHHFALPFTLAALCSCLALLRVNSRLKRDDLTFFARSWPALLGMGFFIGAVFPVNIWDAVVLTPLYAVVILVAWRNVHPGEAWKWVGFAGFIILLSMVCGLLLNSVPGAAPLFQNFKFFLLATVILVAGIAAVPHLLKNRQGAGLIAVIAAAALIIVVGALLAPGLGGANAPSQMATGIRDLLLFGIIAAVAASWTMGKTLPVHRWWYSAGAVYAAVGILALVVILPFQLFFQSPLEPQNRIFYDLMPPVLSHELITAKDAFWATFWKGSPVNPFDANIRTEVRDFKPHWGIFFIPVLIFAIGRFFLLSKMRKNGYGFMVAMLVLGIMAFSRNSLRFWVGSISLGMMTLSLFYAFNFRRRSEGPIWAFLSVAFFWTWFVEGLHFDDDYSGYLERYNTPFKIYYPLWPIFAGGMVVAVRELLGRFPSRERNAKGLLKSQVFWGYIFIVGILTPFLIRQILPDGVASVWYMAFWLLALLVIVSAIFALFSDKQKNREADVLAGEASRTMAQWPALLAGSIIFAIGMYYPVAATVTRTHDFFKWPMVDSYDYRVPHRNIFVFRTLEGFSHYQDYPKYRQDFKAWVWMRDNLPEGAKILERPGRDPYSHVSRMSTGSGHPTVIGWAGHQNQWRGRAKAAPLNMKDRYIAEVAGLPDLNNEFNKVLGQGKSTLTTEQQNLLRMSKPKERLKRLREFFPGATLMQLYRLRFIVEKNDVNMNMIMDRMVADAADMYKSDDRERVRSLFGAYDIEYVVVGDLERQEFGSNLGPRFEGWGFTKIYDSAAELLPIDETDINTPTVVYQVPADFPVGEEKR